MKKIRVTQRVIDGILDIGKWAEALECSERTMYRYMVTLKEEWPPGFIHGLSGKPSNHTAETSKYAFIRRTAHDKRFLWWWPTFLAEKIEELYNEKICHETLRQRMIKWWLWEAHPRKRIVVRVRRERVESYGMMGQFDWSYHDWFSDGNKECLLVAIDDATGIPIKMVFGRWEWLEDIYAFWKAYMWEHGKPVSIYLDRHATYKVNWPEDIFDEEMRTRFSRAMERIWVTIIYARSPEWKWRVERWFRTHQDRLVKELKLAGIRTIDEANKFLVEYYIPKHIKKFWVAARKEWDFHVKQGKEEQEEMTWIFAQESERTLKSDNTIAYKSKVYQIKKWVTIARKAKVKVCASMEWKIRLYYGWELLPYALIPYR